MILVYNTIAAAIKVRDTLLSYSELFDKLTDYERAIKETSSTIESIPATVNYTSRQQGSNNRTNNSFSRANRSYSSGQSKGAPQSQWSGNNSPGNRPTRNNFCQFCNIPGHLTRDCRKLVRFLRDNNVNTDPTKSTPVAHVTTSAPVSPSWLFDTGASNHVTSNRNTLHSVSEYGGPDEIVLGDGTGLLPFLQSHGISHYTTPPHTPEQNGVAEHRHRHIVATELALLHYAKLSLSFWSHAFQTAVYLINRLPTPVLHNQSPYECLFRQTPTYSKLKPFGCLCYPWLRPYKKSKLEPRSTPCLFLGYSSFKSSFKCYDLTTRRLYHSRHVEFILDQFPSHKLPTTDPLPTPDVFLNPPTSCPIEKTTPVSPPIPPVMEMSAFPTSPHPTHDNVDQTSNDQPSSPTLTSPTSASSTTSSPQPTPSPRQPSQTRTQKPNSKYFNPSFVNSSTLHPIPTTVEPTTHTQALKNPQWRHTMDQEFNALMQNGT
ncbi:hypothetical protein LXL04_032061 [Taraxacum kok-saghyz]